MPTPPLIDVNAFLGAWPFSPAPEETARALAARLGRHGVRRALVSHLGGVFQPEPMASNRALFAATRRAPRLVPAPILNPALEGWREDLAACRAALAPAPLRAVRLLPGYHGWRLAARRHDAFFEALAAARARPIVTVRLEDERQMHFALRVKAVPLADIAAWSRRHPKRTLLCTGLYKPEVERLAAQGADFAADLSFAEAMDTVAALARARLMFGSAAPLMSLPAQVAKIRETRAPAALRARVADGDARRFFSL